MSTPTTVAEYIASYDGEVKTRMEALRELILASSPDITEKISWGMATFVLNGNLVHFAGHQAHIGLYPSPEAIEAFSDRLTEYKTSKGTIQFPNNKPFPLGLIGDIVAYRVKTNSR